MNQKYISDSATFRRSGDFPRIYENLSLNELLQTIQQMPSIAYKVHEQTGQTLLLRCVETNNIEKVVLMINAGSDINAQNSSGETSLYIAVDNCNYKLIQLLLQSGANPNIQQQDGESPLHLAAFKNETNIVKLLFDFGANPFITTFYSNYSPLDYAQQKNSQKAVELIYNHMNKLRGFKQSFHNNSLTGNNLNNSYNKEYVNSNQINSQINNINYTTFNPNQSSNNSNNVSSKTTPLNKHNKKTPTLSPNKQIYNKKQSRRNSDGLIYEPSNQSKINPTRYKSINSESNEAVIESQAFLNQFDNMNSHIEKIKTSLINETDKSLETESQAGKQSIDYNNEFTLKSRKNVINSSNINDPSKNSNLTTTNNSNNQIFNRVNNENSNYVRFSKQVNNNNEKLGFGNFSVSHHTPQIEDNNIYTINQDDRVLTLKGDDEAINTQTNYHNKREQTIENFNPSNKYNYSLQNRNFNIENSSNDNYSNSNSNFNNNVSFYPTFAKKERFKESFTDECKALAYFVSEQNDIILNYEYSINEDNASQYNAEPEESQPSVQNQSIRHIEKDLFDMKENHIVKTRNNKINSLEMRNRSDMYYDNVNNIDGYYNNLKLSSIPSTVNNRMNNSEYYNRDYKGLSVTGVNSKVDNEGDSFVTYNKSPEIERSVRAKNIITKSSESNINKAQIKTTQISQSQSRHNSNIVSTLNNKQEKLNHKTSSNTITSQQTKAESYNKDIFLFLKSIHMEEYTSILVSNGFDDLTLLIEQSKYQLPFSDEELKSIGVSLPGDRAKIIIRLEEISKYFNFEIPPSVYHNFSVTESMDMTKLKNDQIIVNLDSWLKQLKLEKLLDNFLNAGYFSVETLLIQMASLNPITDSLLENDILIDKIGYRTRILNKLKMGKYII